MGKLIWIFLAMGLTSCGSQVESAGDTKVKRSKAPVCQSLPTDGLHVIYVQDGKVIDYEELP
jgi:hypothetical protein